MMRGAILALSIALSIPTAARSQPAEETIRVLRFGTATDTVTVVPGQRRVCFDRSPMLVGTLSLTRNSVLLEAGIDYTVDENAGCVELVALPTDTLRFAASYRYLPVSVPLRIQLHRPETIGAPTAVGAPRSLAALPEEDGTRLRVGGSKTFTVEVGSNRDAALRQSLDLQVRGSLARDVELSAVLSDRDSPVTPEGTSAELEELDKVLIQVRSRNAEATFGDIEVRQTDGLFARYERQLEGAEVKRTGRFNGGALAASARGAYRTIEFFGVEGQQGPYDIADPAAGGRIAIVPGSEEVTLDGEPLTRGQTRDYTIDYSLGEITFTPNRPITFDSRVTIDFEEETETYRRQFFSAHAGATIDEGFSVKGFFISEGDDRDAPRGFSLNDDEKAILADVGDDEPVGETFAAQFVGDGNGDYVEVAADSLAPKHFEWVGPGEGDFLVNFIRVGESLGSYADSLLVDDTVIYRFVGTGLGDFEPGRSLVRPESHAVGDLIVRYDAGRVGFEGEVAVSARDRNTFSSFDDGDNDGLAGRGELRLQGPTWAKGKGGVRVDASWRHIDEDFTSFSRVRESFDFLDWNYDPDALTEGEDRSRLAIALSPGGGGEATVEVGRLASGDRYDAERFGAGYRIAGPVVADARWSRTWSDEPTASRSGLREVARAQLSMPWRRVTPTVRYRSESTETNGDSLATGQRFESIGVENRVALPGPLSLRVDFTRRLDDRRGVTGSEWSRSSKTRDRGAELTLGSWRGMQGVAEYRRRTFESREATASVTTNLARLNWVAQPRERPIRLQLDYQVTTESEAVRSKVIEFVGDGRGNYDSLGVFVGTGDYDVSIEDSGDTELLSRLDVVLRGSLLGATRSDLSPFWRSVQANSFLRIRRSSRDPFEELINPFRGAFFSTGAGTVDGSLTMRHEVTLFSNERLSPRVRWERGRRVDGRFENVRDLREEDVVALQLRATPRAAWTVRAEGAYERTSDIVERTVPTTARDSETFTTRRLEGEVSHKPAPVWTLALGAEVGRTSAPNVEGTEREVIISPRVAWIPGRIGRAEVRLSWVDVSGALVRRRPSFAFGLDNTSGIEWSTLADVRLKDYLTLAGSLRSVRPRGGETFYDGRMELRAFF